MPDMSSMRSDNPGRYPFMTFHFQEEARARLLPNQHSVEWLAALKRFEAIPDPESGTTPVPGEQELCFPVRSRIQWFSRPSQQW